MLNDVFRDFISEEQRSFRFRIGKMLASSLTGFIFGAIFSTIIWVVAVSLYKYLSQ